MNRFDYNKLGQIFYVYRVKIRDTKLIIKKLFKSYEFWMDKMRILKKILKVAERYRSVGAFNASSILLSIEDHLNAPVYVS